MRRKPLALVLVGLIILSAFMAGCRRSSAAPPLEELTTEEEAAAVMLEAQANTEEMQAAEEEAPVVTEELTEASPDSETDAEEPAEEAETSPDPAATTPPVDPAAEESAVEPATTDSTGATTHVVQPGENLFQISLRYATTVQALSQANNITNPGLIYVGQTLQIPDGSGTTAPTTTAGQTCATVYVVQPGDNLFRIALSYDYSQFYLAQYNGLANPSMVYVGQQLCIP